MEDFLSPSKLARVIGASESSIKRWADEGKLDVAHTAGGHRRISLPEALRFIRESNLPIIDPRPLGLADLDSPRPTPAADPDAALQQALIAGRPKEVRGLVVAMYLKNRDLAELCDGPLAHAMHHVGTLWKQGPHGIHEEHRATDICAQALHFLRTLMPPAKATAPLALGGAIEADPYMIPSLMVSTVLAAARWRDVNLGANLPFDAILAAVETHRPQLVWLSCSVQGLPEQSLRGLQKTARTLAEKRIAFVLGGRGFSPAFLAQANLPATRFTHTLRELAAFAEGLRAR